MPRDKFAGTTMRNRIQKESFDKSCEFGKSMSIPAIAKRKRRRKPSNQPKQSVKEFLAAGGKITKVPTGVAFSGSGGVLKRGR